MSSPQRGLGAGGEVFAGLQSPHPRAQISPHPRPQISPHPHPQISPHPRPRSRHTRPQIPSHPRPQISPHPRPQISPHPRPQISPHPRPQITPHPRPQISPHPRHRFRHTRATDSVIPAPQIPSYPRHRSRHTRARRGYLAERSTGLRAISQRPAQHRLSAAGRLIWNGALSRAWVPACTGMTGGARTCPRRGVAGVKRVGCWARRDTRGKRGYDGALLRESDGVGSRGGEGSVGGEGGAYAAVG